MVCLQETKLKVVNCSVVNSQWNCNWNGWLERVAKRAFGDILIMWDKRLVDLVYQWPADSIILMMVWNRPLLEFMIPTWIPIDIFFEMKLRVFSAVGISHSV